MILLADEKKHRTLLYYWDGSGNFSSTELLHPAVSSWTTTKLVVWGPSVWLAVSTRQEAGMVMLNSVKMSQITSQS